MEQNLPIIAKKFWNIVRVAYFMLRKGISSKGKLFADLTMMMKRGKIAGKAALHNLMFHHHLHLNAATAATRRSTQNHHISFPFPLNEYEFSCGNSPAAAFHLPFHFKKGKNNSYSQMSDEVLMAAALQMINSATASPALPGFGPSPMVRQLRITDSPFPLSDQVNDHHVDEAAEQFIMKFYKDLKKQNAVGYLSYS